MMVENGSRKGTIENYFANPKKHSESISHRQIDLSNRENKSKT